MPLPPHPWQPDQYSAEELAEVDKVISIVEDSMGGKLELYKDGEHDSVHW